MTSLTTRAYLSARNYLTELKERRDDQGASMLEYVGVLVLVAIVVGIVIFAVQEQESDIVSGVGDIIGEIMDGGRRD